MRYCSKAFSAVFLWLIILLVFFPIENSLANPHFFNAIMLNNTDEDLARIKKLLAEGDTKKALEELYIYIDKVENNNNTIQIIESKILLADILRDNGDFIKSNSVFYEVIPLIKNNAEKLQYVYFKQGGNFQLDSKIDSAKVNYEKAIIFAEKVAGNQDLRAKIHANLSGIFYLIEDYENAIAHSKIAINYQKELGNVEIEAGILNNLGGIYYMQGKYNDALATFEEAFNLVGYGQNEIQKKTRSTSFINMAYAYSGLGNFEKAFEFQDKYFSLNDSLQQELKYKEIAEIESKYQVATKEKEAAIEKTKRQEAEVLTYGLGIAILILLLGIYTLYKVYKLNKKNHALQISKEQLLNQNKLDKIKSESQSKILVATMDGRIQERKNISDILHGNVSALLSAANLHLYASEMQFNGNIPEEIEKTKGIISEASVQVRALSHTLISAVLLKQGLSEAIKDICEKSSNGTIHLKCESKNITRFNNDFEIKIFNIIQELINNMLKHSNAESGNVKLEQLNGALQILVFDNGKGFNVEEEKVDAGIGLSQIKARIENLKGILQITSSNKGTRVFISVPIVY
jgi:signal transduction histidine kinase